MIAVASGKGGVGKSTIAVNLACGLQKLGYRVGLLDADIYGPSQHIMLGLNHQNPIIDQDKKLLPIEKFGMYAMSFGFFVKPDQAVIWRGPMISRMLQQFVQDVIWPELDYLIVDLPPGTGDIQLTLSQLLKVTGVVIVSTPQAIALADAVKGIHMFQKVEVSIVGIVENMSHFECPHCHETSNIFANAGAKQKAAELKVPYLAGIPLEQRTRELCDQGHPIVLAEPDSVQARLLMDLARQVDQQVSDLLSKHPEILTAEPVQTDNTKPFSV